tara:strand:- start:36629 stop:37450 length:822 start_codon:yes stop_codon:yes gene_type:complete
MVFEVLVNPQKVSGKPWEMFFIGSVYALVGFILGFWVFRSQVSLIMVSFTAIVSVPFIHSAIETQQSKNFTKGSLYQKHGRMLEVFVFLFLGFMTTFLLIFLAVPESIQVDTFSTQLSSINDIRTQVSGSFTEILSPLASIIANNLQVLSFCVLFSFFYGAGAIFILSWNASVMGVAIGGTMQKGFSAMVGSSFAIISGSLVGYFAHGIPEIIAFFVGGLAGGIVSISVMKDGISSESFKKNSTDALNMIAFAIIILILAGLVEIFVSPNFFP